MKKTKLFFLVAVALLFSISSNANAALLKSYDFNGGLSDTLGNGVDLVDSGGTVSGGRYSFLDNQGLSLSSALANTSSYGIEMKLEFTDSLDNFNKLIDFQGLSSDNGLYVFGGTTIEFFPIGSAAVAVSLNTDFTVGLARSAGIIEVFLNGLSLFTTADGTSQAISILNVLNFFEDDNPTGQSESFTGSVDWIRIHDDASTFGTAPAAVSPVPLPASLPLFGMGLAILGLLGWRRKRKIAITA